MKYVNNKLFRILFVVLIVGSISDVQALYMGDDFPDYVESDYADQDTSESIIGRTKMDEVFDFFFARLSLLDSPKGADFVKIYNDMPKDLQRELCRIYFDVPKDDQDAIAASYGYSGPELRAIAEKEIALKVKKAVIQQANKTIKSLKKIFKF